MRRLFQARRQNDPTYKDVLTLKYAEALDLYKVVVYNLGIFSLDKTQAHPERLFRKGLEEFKHALADLHVGLTMAEHAGWYAAHAIELELPDAAVAVSVAKVKANDAARLATSTMIQYHGGIGYTWEHEAHLFFKRARRLEQTYGDSAHHRERIARLTV